MFAEIAEGRFNSTLQSGLLCAVILLPATAWAASVNGATDNQEAPQIAMATVPSAVPASTAPTGTGPAPAAQPAQPAQPAQSPPSIQPAQPSKLATLSRHIQSRYGISEPKANQIVGQAIDNGSRHQLDPELLLAIIAVESTFRERAVSRVGARGLMQVMPGVHRDKLRNIGGTRALFDPAKNIHTGAQILNTYLSNHSGDLRRALLNYNGSLGHKRSSYADRVMDLYRDFQRVTTQG